MWWGSPLSVMESPCRTLVGSRAPGRLATTTLPLTVTLVYVSVLGSIKPLTVRLLPLWSTATVNSIGSPLRRLRGERASRRADSLRLVDSGAAAMVRLSAVACPLARAVADAYHAATTPCRARHSPRAAWASATRAASSSPLSRVSV